MSHRVYHVFCLIFFGLLCQSVFAQNAPLTGTVEDEGGSPVSFANVVALAGDSAFLAGTTTGDTGKYSLEIGARAAFVRISYVGLETVIYPVGSVPRRVVLKNAGTELEGVSVEAARPTLALKGSAIELSVEGTTLSNRTDISDVLKQIPGLTVSSEGTPSLFGGGTLLIEVDGREVHSNQELTGIDVKDIQSVSLDRTPGTRYRSNVRGVLRIKTARWKRRTSFLASSRLNLNHRFYTEEQLQGGYSTNRASYFGSFGYSDYRYLKDQSITTTLRPEEPSRSSELATSMTEEFAMRRFKWQASADFTLSERFRIGLKYLGGTSSIYDYINDDTRRSEAGKPVGVLHTDSRMTQPGDYHHLNLYSGYDFSDALSLTVNGDLFVDNTSRRQVSDVTEDGALSSVDLKSDNRYTLWQIKPVLSWGFAQGFRLEIGGEAGDIRGHGVQDRDGKTVMDYLNDEALYAGFASLAFPIGDKWTGNVGLRYEYAHSGLYNTVGGQGDIDRRYSNLFFSGKVSGKIGETAHTLSFDSYIDRPSMSQLSNFSYFSSRYLIQESNPRLIPEQDYNLGYTFLWKILYFNLSYTYVKDRIHMSFKVNPDFPDGYILSYANYDKSQKVQAVLNVRKTWDWYTLNATGALMYDLIDGSKFGLDIKRRPNLNFYLTQTASLPRKWTLSVDYTYVSPGMWGIFMTGSQHQVDVNLNKTLLDGRLSIGLDGRDIFRTSVTTSFTALKDLQMRSSNYQDVRTVSLKVTYRFNKSKEYRGGGSADSAIGRIK